MKKKFILCISLLLAAGVPSHAVFNETSINKTIDILKQELKMSVIECRDDFKRNREEQRLLDEQHAKMVEMAERCNELSLILYSQEPRFTFGITYALDKVSEEYYAYKAKARPHVRTLEEINIEIERYEKLASALARIPPQLDSVGTENDSTIAATAVAAYIATAKSGRAEGSAFIGGLRMLVERMSVMSKDSSGTVAFSLDEAGTRDRDTCIALTNAMLVNYNLQKSIIVRDSIAYTMINASLDSAYKYVTARYADVQKQIYGTGQDSYFTVLKNFSSYCSSAASDSRKRFAIRRGFSQYMAMSEWSGIRIAGLFEVLFASLLMVTALTMLTLLLLRRRFSKLQTPGFKRIRSTVIAIVALTCTGVLCIITWGQAASSFVKFADTIILLYLWLVLSILFFVIIGFKGKDVRISVRSFAPILVIGAMVMVGRMLFIPDRMLNLILFPILAIVAIWQAYVCKGLSEKKMHRLLVLHRMSLAFIVASAVAALFGYVLLGVQIMMWWTLQVSFIATLHTLHALSDIYYKNRLSRKMEEYKEEHPCFPKSKEGGDCIKVTWLYDLIDKVFWPVARIVSIFLCILIAAEMFNLGEVCKIVFFKPLIDLKNQEGLTVLHVSGSRILCVLYMFFIFRYLNYLIRSFHRLHKYETLMKEEGRNMIQPNEVNLTLANNVIGLLLWGIYIITSVYILGIPLGALSAILAGLAAGIGFALKDVLNNFIYGLQLMAGRLKVGDCVECNGDFGCVSRISYQTTEIQTFDGPVISYLNSALFNANFKNISKSTPYQRVTIPVCFAYSADFDRVHELLEEALKSKAEEKDKFGRYIVEQKSGINLRFGEYGEGNVSIEIRMRILSDYYSQFAHEISEMAYKLLKENNIDLPQKSFGINAHIVQ